jgi:hypothetical protein
MIISMASANNKYWKAQLQLKKATAAAAEAGSGSGSDDQAMCVSSRQAGVVQGFQCCLSSCRRGSIRTMGI